MKFGICIPNYGETMNVMTLRNVAIEAENLGYDSVWTTDHILMPKNSQTPYENILDCITTLAYLAPQTETVKLGISLLVLAMRNPVVVAKQLASVDAFSEGRLLLAVGAGWSEKEFSFLGSNFHNRGKRIDESIKLIRKLWAGETEFTGSKTGISFKDVVFEPRRPSGKLTIWIGGTSKAAMKRAAELGDVWHPNVQPLDVFKKLVEEFRQVSPKAKNMEMSVRIGLNTKATQSQYTSATGEKRILLSGDMSENRKIVSELESLGVNYAILSTSPTGKTIEEEQLQSIRDFAKEFL